MLLYKIKYNKPIPHPPLTYLLSDLSNSYISWHQLHAVKSTNSEVKGTKWCRWGAFHGRHCVPFPVICTPSITLTVKLSHALNWLWLHILVSNARINRKQRGYVSRQSWFPTCQNVHPLLTFTTKVAHAWNWLCLDILVPCVYCQKYLMLGSTEKKIRRVCISRQAYFHTRQNKHPLLTFTRKVAHTWNWLCLLLLVPCLYSEKHLMLGSTEKKSRGCVSRQSWFPTCQNVHPLLTFTTKVAHAWNWLCLDILVPCVCTVKSIWCWDQQEKN